MLATRVLHVRLFGLLSVHAIDTEGRTEVIPLTGRPASLLAFLALFPGRLFHRNDLQAMLWSDRCDDVAAGALNTALWRLRRAIEKPPARSGSVIACNSRGALGLPSSEEVLVDVQRFDALTSAVLAKPLDRLDAKDTARLREGVALYDGDVLGGFHDEWALRARERHRLHHLNALGRLMQVSTRAADYGDAIQHGRAILYSDPLREDVHRQLMSLFVANGQRALALRQFEVCRDALRRELAIAPMPETVELYRRLAEEASPPPVRHRDHAVGGTGLVFREGTDAKIVVDGSVTDRPSPTLRECIATARSNLQVADQRLEQALVGLDKPAF